MVHFLKITANISSYWRNIYKNDTMFENLSNIKLLSNQHFEQLWVIIKWKVINLIMNVESKVIGHVQGAKDCVIAGGIYYFHCCDELKFALILFRVQDMEGFECIRIFFIWKSSLGFFSCTDELTVESFCVKNWEITSSQNLSVWWRLHRISWMAVAITFVFTKYTVEHLCML